MAEYSQVTQKVHLMGQFERISCVTVPPPPHLCANIATIAAFLLYLSSEMAPELPLSGQSHTKCP
jgi:hypothetical protein